MDKIAFQNLIEKELEQESSNSYQPEIDDLFFLYSLVKDKSVTSILEYGSGWSTYALGLALHENYLNFGDEHRSNIRHPDSFKLLTIDASDKFQKIALKRIPLELQKNIVTVVSKPVLVDIGGVICHRFEYIPNMAADLIYLDGPDHDQVIGVINGFEYKESFTQPMGSDILMIEPYLWPETIIVTDGRTANARFLASRLKRNWQILEDPFGDRTIFRLHETPLGSISSEHIDFRIKKSRQAVFKEEPQR